jgi:hypothetical protein
MGATKTGEYWRTIEMLMQKTGKTDEEVAMILYFLHDMQYGNDELKEMADLVFEYKAIRERSGKYGE